MNGASAGGHLRYLPQCELLTTFMSGGVGAIRVTDYVYVKNGPVGSCGECITTFDQEK